MAEPREHGLLLRGDMVRAVLGVELPGGVPKRRTWRPMEKRAAWWWASSSWEVSDDGWPVAADPYGDWHRVPCHLGAAGDRLWVRETWGVMSYDGSTASVAYAARLAAGKTLANTDGGCNVIAVPEDWRDRLGRLVDTERWRPSIHMPRWASRLTLPVLDVRFLRPRDLPESECREEGFSGRDDFLKALTGIYGPDVLDAHGWAIYFDVLEPQP